MKMEREERLKEYNRECNKKWYEKNKKHHIQKVKDNMKKNNYASEKTEKQRFIRNIKRQTRYYFPLQGHKCEFCGKTAKEHHHNTNPIQFDRFNYICHKCHIKFNHSPKI